MEKCLGGVPGVRMNAGLLKKKTARESCHRNCRETVPRVYQRSHTANDDAIKAHGDHTAMTSVRSLQLTDGCASGVAENRSQQAMNSAAIAGPITKPFKPNSAIPPSVEISTT